MSLGEHLGAGSGITVGLYHLSGNSNDSSGNARHGTDTNISYALAYGKFGQGASFNGTSSKISLPSGVNLSALSAYTIHAWFKSSQATAGLFYGEGQSSTDVPYLQFGMAVGGVISFAHRSDASVSSTITSLSAYNDSAWHLATAVKVASNSRILYVDSDLVGSNSTNLGVTTVNQFNLGVLQRTTSVSWFNGNLDEVSFENVAWSQLQIKKYFTWALGRNPSVMG